MAKLPTTLGDNPTPRPQRRVQGYDSQIMARANEANSRDMEKASAQLQEREDRDAVLDAQNRVNAAKKKTLDLLYGDGQTEGLYSSKGSGAMGTEDKYSKSWTAIRDNALNGVTNRKARDALQADLDNLNLSNVDNVKRFEMTERKGYTLDLNTANQATDQQRAALEYNNDETINKLLVGAEKTGITAAKLKGAKPGDAIWNQEVLNAKSSILTARLESMAASKDDQELMQFAGKYEEYRKQGLLSLASVDKFDGVMKVLQPKINAMKAFGEITGQQVTYDAPVDALFKGMTTQESGGKQTGGAGSVAGPNEPTTSPKGAIGIMQIMPDTGPEAAKLAGLTWDADKFKTDSAYNSTLGQAYYKAQVDKFGDQRMALMAYNAGPGIVQDWIDGTNKSGKNDSKLKLGDPSKGQTTVDQFIARVPWAETRQYPGKVMKAAGYTGQQGAIDPDKAAAVAAGMDDDSRETFLKMVKQNNEAFAATSKAEINGVTGDIITKVMQSGWEAVPPSWIARAQESGAYSVIKDYDPTKPSDVSTVNYLYGLDAKGLKEADLDSPEVRGRLSPEDYGRWKAKQQKIDGAAESVTTDLRKKMVDKAFATRGLERGKEDSDNNDGLPDKNQARYARVNQLIDLEVDAYAQNNNGRMPGPVDMQRIIDNTFINTELPTDRGVFGMFQAEKPVYDITLDDIETEDQEQIRASLREQGIAPTDARVIMTYAALGGADTRSEVRKGLTSLGKGVGTAGAAVSDWYKNRPIIGRETVLPGGMLLNEMRSSGDYFRMYNDLGDRKPKE